MSVVAAPIHGRAAELREAFDRSFAEVARSEAGAVQDLLAIRLGADPYALRRGELSGLFADKKVTWLPSPVPELLGVAGFRGAVLPIYDLGMLLGCPKAAQPRWTVVAAAAQVGLAFEGFDGYLNVPDAAIVPAVRTERRESHVREILRIDVARPIIDLSSILKTIEQRAGHDRPTS